MKRGARPRTPPPEQAVQLPAPPPHLPDERDAVRDAEELAQIQRCELLHARHFSREEILRTLISEFGITEGAADERLRTVRAHWRTEALNHGDVHDQRERARRGFAYLLNVALDYRRPLRNPDGTPLTFTDSSTGEVRPVMAPEPDLQIAVRSQVELAKLAGLYTRETSGDGKSIGDLAAQLRIARAARLSGAPLPPNLDPRIARAVEPGAEPEPEPADDSDE